MKRRMNQRDTKSEPPMAPDPVKVRLPKELIERIDAYRARVPTRPTRSQIIRFLLDHALNIIEEHTQ